MPFDWLRRHPSAEPDIEWFRRFAEIPGIEWQPPLAIQVDSRLAGARPVTIPARDRYEGGPMYRWVDASGQPITDRVALHDSPTEVLTSGSYDQPPERQLELALGALELPGTRYEYAQALGAAERAIQYGGLQRLDALEALLRAHISLMLAGPRAALTSPWSDYETPLERAGEPFVQLMSLYQKEGFLREAAVVEGWIESLPGEAKPRFIPEPRPSEVVEALRGLA
jgi:hypothetical protein